MTLSVAAKPVIDEHGVFRGHRGITRDVTASVRTEDALRDSESRLRGFLDTSPIGVSIVDMQSGKRL